MHSLIIIHVILLGEMEEISLTEDFSVIVADRSIHQDNGRISAQVVKVGFESWKY
jgi:hypothetical protein